MSALGNIGVLYLLDVGEEEPADVAVFETDFGPISEIVDDMDGRTLVEDCHLGGVFVGGGGESGGGDHDYGVVTIEDFGAFVEGYGESEEGEEGEDCGGEEACFAQRDGVHE